MSSEATNYVRDQWQGPRRLRCLMLIIASYCDRDGRGCRASTDLLAAGVDVNDRNVRKQLTELRDGGHIVAGDPRLVAGYAPGRRPAVYDLAGMVAKPVDNPEEGGSHVTPHGGRTSAEGGSHVTPKTLSLSGRETRAGAREGSSTPARRADDQPHDAAAPPPNTHAFEEDPRTPGVCVQCGFPRANARHNPHRQEGRGNGPEPAARGRNGYGTQDSLPDVPFSPEGVVGRAADDVLRGVERDVLKDVADDLLVGVP